MTKLMKRPIFLLTLLALAGCPCLAQTPSLADRAAQFHTLLATRVLPYWYDTAVDWTNGGYILADELKGRMPATEKQIVTQARAVWGFSLAHLKGYSTAQRHYLKAAENGYRFLATKLRDPQNGGYFWATDLQGKVIDDRKQVYGQSFVMYALAEYYTASGDKEALRDAMELYHCLQKNAHDVRHRGWFEHFTRDWQLVDKPGGRVWVEKPGCKSANTHLHLMEAFTDLYQASRDAEVRASLAEALDLNRRYFYPLDASKAAYHCRPDWQPVLEADSAGLSYGHNVEFAWLMVRAQQALKEKPDWQHFAAHVDHALAHGYDWTHGGLYYRGVGNEPATVTDKVWWAEAELIAALTVALQHEPNPRYRDALDKQIDFLARFQTAPDGIWVDNVTAEGKPKGPRKAHSWKANYHDVRAMQMLVDAFPR